jgi:hypothetical protein
MQRPHGLPIRDIVLGDVLERKNRHEEDGALTIVA